MTEDVDVALAVAIEATDDNSGPVRATLQTDGRVLARVTDGIYRQPGSAIRELISNAYDADATQVFISTDRPRFSRITIEDDGHGMSPRMLAHLVHHIGGSVKRSEKGADLGVTDVADSSRSPGGRRLIGRIGIGLFAVSQITRNFQIVTKVKGDPWRTIASVSLRQHSDLVPVSDSDEYEAGHVSIWRERAFDVEAHGTTIVLSDIRPKTRNTLQSLGDWVRDSASREAAGPTLFHVGRQDPSSSLSIDEISDAENVPWSNADSPDVAFDKLVNAVLAEAKRSTKNPRLEIIFDYYLQMCWQLGLACPLSYVEQGPFELTGDDAHFFELSGPGPGPARSVVLKDSEAFGSALDWDPRDRVDGPFAVYVDNLEIRRPIKFKGLVRGSHAVQKPIIFAGRLREEFSGVDTEISGGPLEFTAYLMWAPKIVPVEHAGCLIRVFGASGTVFDPTFMKFQVAEITRLRQISCEIFVHEGFESALNIDRESFNYAHPHVVRLTSWLHTALTRVMNEQKRMASKLRKEARAGAALAEATALSKIASDAWKRRTGDESTKPTVAFVDEARGTGLVSSPSADLIFPRKETLGGDADSWSGHAKSTERKIEAIVQVLAAYGLFESLEPADQDAVVASIGAILRAES